LFLLSDKNYFWRTWIIAFAFLVGTGFVYRQARARESLIESKVSIRTIPLKHFPINIYKWIGKDISMDYPIKEATGSNDYLLRLYKTENGQWVHLYITYCSQPRNMLGHRPEVCFRASGWNILDEEKTTFTTTSGKTIPCIKYLFEKPVGLRDEFTVLNFYILNGRLTEDHKEFSGIKWRRLANPKEQVRYVTQIQISSSNEEAAISAAKEMSDLIIKFFPDEQGQVKASLAISSNNLQ